MHVPAGGFSDVGSGEKCAHGNEESAMKRPNEHTQLPVHDYGLAVQNAVSWLGDRYLLAAPATRRVDRAAGYGSAIARRWAPRSAR